MENVEFDFNNQTGTSLLTMPISSFGRLIRSLLTEGHENGFKEGYALAQSEETQRNEKQGARITQLESALAGAQANIAANELQKAELTQSLTENTAEKVELLTDLSRLRIRLTQLESALAGAQAIIAANELAKQAGAKAKMQPEKTPKSGGKRNLSAEARKRIADAQRKRWAEFRKAKVEAAA